MKSWKRAVAVALCAASLLVGCGVQSGNVSNDDSTDEPQQITSSSCGLRTIRDPCSKSTAL